MALKAEGQLEAALTEYKSALSINPMLAPAYTNIGAVYFSKGNFERAKDALNKAIELSPMRAAPYINLATIALRQRRPESALELLNKAESLENSYMIHFNKAEALFQLGRYREAAHEYNLVLELAPDSYEMTEQIRHRLKQMTRSKR